MRKIAIIGLATVASVALFIPAAWEFYWFNVRTAIWASAQILLQ